MKKLIFFVLMALALTANAYNVSLSGNDGYGYYTVNGVQATTNVVSEISGRTEFGFVSTNSAWECSGMIFNGGYVSGRSPWVFYVNYDSTLSCSMTLVPPQPFGLPNGVMAITAELSSSWKKIVFAQPNSVKFDGDYLFPSGVNCLTIKAVEGDIEVNTTTNGTTQVSTLGNVATIPISPAVIEEGTALVINAPVSVLYMKGSGKANIVGVKTE